MHFGGLTAIQENLLEYFDIVILVPVLCRKRKHCALLSSKCECLAAIMPHEEQGEISCNDNQLYSPGKNWRFHWRHFSGSVDPQQLQCRRSTLAS